MAKQPDINSVPAGYYSRSLMNRNFEQIVEAFKNTLSRDGSLPNEMNANLDVADATITNTNSLEVKVLTVGAFGFEDFDGQYIYKLGELVCNDGAILTHDAVGDPICLAPDADGLVLKSDGTTVQWAEDLDTDTDTVGVTIQEDGVTVAENVTNIDFTFPDAVVITTPGAPQVDFELAPGSAFWEDSRATDDANIDPQGPSSGAFDDPAQVNRLDLINDAGLSAVPTADNDWYVIMESSSALESNSTPDAGSWSHAVKFFDNTGTATALTGVEITKPAGETSSAFSSRAGGALQTVYCGIPAGTRYVDFGKGDAFLFPLFITKAVIDNRYRAIISKSAKNLGFETPNGKTWPGGEFPSVTP